MRKIIEPQLELGQVPISEIKINLKSRDEIPKILIGLQALFCNHESRTKIFQLLEKLLPPNVNRKNGRKGMYLWRILVLGMIRLGCDWDYDKLLDIANNHKTLRLMLGHGGFSDEYVYKLQTLKDNVSLFTPEILDEINHIAVEYGHNFFFENPENEELKVSCDSFVTETDVHFPTDINLLLDSLRKVITLIMSLCIDLKITEWRQGKYNFKKIKRFFRKAQQTKRSTSKDPDKKAKRGQLIIAAHNEYLILAKAVIEKAKKALSFTPTTDICLQIKIGEILKYIQYAEKFIDQINRRVIDGETIPHNEKVFSIFEEHTEWISKGKAGVPQQLGIRVCIVRDQFGFILQHKVMENATDDKVAVSIIFDAKQKFKNITSCSFDKGFHSPANQKELGELLDTVILPFKGKLSEKRKAIEYSEEFLDARKKHSAVESSISALQNHGLVKCPDHGIRGFKRYVSMGMLARNLQILGHAIQQKELKCQKKKCMG
ncbi:MAG: ISNCY family transposase [Desulfobacula sp.]|jgi:IS5 family transposase|nr:ISNCY family transposase [Desulfobacula sp.]